MYINYTIATNVLRVTLVLLAILDCQTTTGPRWGLMSNLLMTRHLVQSLSSHSPPHLAMLILTSLNSWNTSGLTYC